MNAILPGFVITLLYFDGCKGTNTSIRVFPSKMTAFGFATAGEESMAAAMPMGMYSPLGVLIIILFQ